jgi:uncharacterized membrane protein
MSDALESARSRPRPIPDKTETSFGTVSVIYVLYLVSLAVGITAIIGLIMAYVNQSEASDWERSHYRFQIRTFWIGLLYWVLSFVLAFVLIGFLLMLVVVVWTIVRCARGLQYAGRQEPFPDPGTWGF